MKPDEISIGDEVQYYYFDNEKRLRHIPVKITKKNSKSVRIVPLSSGDERLSEFRCGYGEIRNQQIEMFDG